MPVKGVGVSSFPSSGSGAILQLVGYVGSLVTWQVVLGFGGGDAGVLGVFKTV